MFASSTRRMSPRRAAAPEFAACRCRHLLTSSFHHPHRAACLDISRAAATSSFWKRKGARCPDNASPRPQTKLVSPACSAVMMSAMPQRFAKEKRPAISPFFPSLHGCALRGQRPANRLEPVSYACSVRSVVGGSSRKARNIPTGVTRRC
ncbi:hypothetical protein MRX96_033489 [Rhipicephalus microplus]